MNVTGLKCVHCGREYPAQPLYTCQECGGILEVQYAPAMQGGKLSETFSMMPVEREELHGFGAAPTPLLRSKRLAERIGLRDLWFKCEFANVTASFKDRPVSVATAQAVRFGFKRVIAASSGNAAAATAAAAARLGLECIITVPEGTPEEKIIQTAAYGAKICRVPGAYNNCYALAKELSEAGGGYNVTTTFLNPYSVEGDKLVGYELYETLERMPGLVYVPVGAGPLLVGISKGLREYARQENVVFSTRMIAVQAQGNSPIVKAFEAGRDVVECEACPRTVAGGIADGLVGYEQDGTHTLTECRKSGGAARAVTDEEILKAQKLLASEEGLFVEPSSAAAMAAVIRDASQGRIDPKDCCVVLLTGHGLKDMKSAQSGVVVSPLVRSAAELKALLD